MIAQRETQGRVKKTMMALALAAVVIAVACDTPAPTQIADQPETKQAEPSRIVLSSEVAADRPLIFVNGDFSGQVVSDLDLNPDDIDRIEVLKGPAAMEIYGARAAYGVIQIFTKPLPEDDEEDADERSN